MPMFNPETKRQSAQWKHTDSPPPKKFRVTASSEKMMVAMFWDSESVILIAFPSYNSDGWDLWRCVTSEVSSSIAWKIRPKKAAAVFFHHDNAPPHRAARVHQFFDNNNFEVVPHAPYSPDLAPSDFWLFATLKDTLRCRTFSSLSALATAVFQWSQRNPK